MTGAVAATGRASGAPLVSVIIPTWNRAPMLRLTLQTALAQDLLDFEIVVIGDGCTDDSEAIVASFHDARVRWYNLPENTGSQSVPNNTALEMARGRYVAHLGHDDYWLPWHLSGLVATIEETGADWVYPLVVAFGPTGLRHCTGPPQPGIPDAEHLVPPSGWLYRRNVFAAVGRWVAPETLPWPIDFDYMRRAALAGTRFAFRPRPTALKFPSNLFPDGYRSGEPSPIQREYFARLQSDPVALEQDLLRELATRFAQLDRGGGKSIFARQQRGRTTTPPFWWSVRRWLIAHYGADRWPVPWLLRGDFQKRRLGRLPRRGLLPAPVKAAPPQAAQPIASLNPETRAGATHREERRAARAARRERRHRAERQDQSSHGIREMHHGSNRRHVPVMDEFTPTLPQSIRPDEGGRDETP